MLSFWHISLLEQTALWLSIKIAFWCMVVSLPWGIALGWLLGKKNFWGKSVLESLVYLPLVLPPVATGYALLLLLGKQGLVGQWLFAQWQIVLAFSWQGAVIASAVVAFPLMVRAIRISAENVDSKLEVAARTLGAGPLRVFYTITLPLMLPGILAGMILAFVRSLGEFGATITFAANIQGETATIPLALFTAMHQPGGEQIALRLALISAILSFIGLWSTEWLSRLLNKYLTGMDS